MKKQKIKDGGTPLRSRTQRLGSYGGPEDRGDGSRLKVNAELA